MDIKKQFNTPFFLQTYFDERLSKLFWAVGILFLSISLGIGGYMIIEGWNLGDAFYMTIITIGTVGFSEVHPLSDEGRLFTAFFIIINLAVFALFASVLTSYILEGELREVFSHYISNRKVKRLNRHVIICGFGKNGQKTCEEFFKEKISFVIIDKNLSLLKENSNEFDRNPNIAYIEGDATQDEILKMAGVERASALITTLPYDADNVFVTLTARQLNPSIKIIARANEATAESKLLRAGADRLVRPDLIGGMYMANLVTRPEVVEFLDMISGTGKLKLEEFCYDDFREHFRNQSILDLGIRNITGAYIMGFKDADEGFLINPTPQTKITEGDVMIVLGTSEQIINFAQYYTTKKIEELYFRKGS
jgi:voltage-gated potassium channel